MHRDLATLFKVRLGFFVVLISIFAFEKLGLTPIDGNEANQT